MQKLLMDLSLYIYDIAMVFLRVALKIQIIAMLTFVLMFLLTLVRIELHILRTVI